MSGSQSPTPLAVQDEHDNELCFVLGLPKPPKKASTVEPKPGTKSLINHEFVFPLDHLPNPLPNFSLSHHNPDTIKEFKTIPSVAESSVTLELTCVVPQEDDELLFGLVMDGKPVTQIRLRRTFCEIEKALLELPTSHPSVRQALSDHTRAALLWYGWKTCSRMVGIKRFSSGFSGSDVLLFRPLLSPPHRDPEKHAEEDFHSSASPNLLSETWGAWLLVKSGPVNTIRKEWARYDVFLKNRLTPFMPRIEAFLRVNLMKNNASKPQQAIEPITCKESLATVISCFLGGDLLKAESMEMMLSAGRDLPTIQQHITRALGILVAWHTHGSLQPLKEFPRFYSTTGGPLSLFNKYDFSDSDDRAAYANKVSWDVSFKKEDHLHNHLWGKTQDGLLFKLSEIKVRFSLTHGDLHPRNILCDQGYAWLIDFEHAGVAPTLHDFAWFEANIRYFCINLVPGHENLDEAANRLELLLLDHFRGSEASLEPVRELAAALGADPDHLFNLASVIAHIRQLAKPYCVTEYADHRDYLAILYLVVLSMLRGDRQSTAPENLRLFVRLAWVLEEQLSHICGMKPFDSGWRPLDLRWLINKHWLAPPQAPQRIQEFVNSDDGAKIFAPLVACRGVAQGDYHHLDVYEHTLLVVAYLEVLISSEDPLAGFLRPDDMDQQVSDNLAKQGLHFLPPLVVVPEDRPECPLSETILTHARAALKAVLTPENQLILKWLALFHDVGKPGVRQMTSKGDGYQIHFYGHPEYGLDILHDHINIWFSSATECGKTSEADRLRYLILRHHDHNNLAKPDSPLAKQLLELAKFVEDPTKIPENTKLRPMNYFAEMMELVETVLLREGELREDFPLLLIQGYADSLASRGTLCPLPLVERARMYVLMLAVWNKRENLMLWRSLLTEREPCQWLIAENGNPTLLTKREQCRSLVTKQTNPNLFDLIKTATDATLDGNLKKTIWARTKELENWAWSYVLQKKSCPTPEQVVEKYNESYGAS